MDTSAIPRKFRLERFPLDGSPSTSLVSALVPIFASFLGDTVYFNEFVATDGGTWIGHDIIRMLVPEGPREVLIDATRPNEVGTGRYLVNDGVRIFWADGPGRSPIRGLCVDERGPVPADAIAVLPEAAANGPNGTILQMAADDTTLYYTVAIDVSASVLYSVSTH